MIKYKQINSIKKSEKLNLLLIFAIIVTMLLLFFNIEPAVKITGISDLQQGKVNNYEIVKTADKIFIVSPDEIINHVKTEKIALNRSRTTQSQEGSFFNHTNLNNSGTNSIIKGDKSGSFYQIINRTDDGIFTGEYYLAVYDNSFNLQEVIFLFKSDALEQLRKKYISLKGIFFYQPKLTKRDQDPLRVEKYKNGYRFVIPENLFDRLKEYPLKDNEDKKFFYHLTHLLRQKLDSEISFFPADILKVFKFFSAKDFWRHKLDCDGYFNPESLKEGVIVGTVNDDNETENLLILLKGGKYLKDKLICFDVKKREIIWEKIPAKNISQIEIHDIDNDKRDEIFIAYSSLSALPDKDYFSEYENSGSSSFPEFIILDCSGNLKEKNQNKFHFKIGGEQKKNITLHFRYFARENIILIGTNSKLKRENRDSLRIVDLEKVAVLTTDFECDRVKYVDYFKGIISTLENSNDDLVKTDYFYNTLSGKLKKIRSYHRNAFFEDGQTLSFLPVLELNNSHYIVSEPFSILDGSLREVLQTDYSFREIVAAGNKTILANCRTYNKISGFGETVKKIELYPYHNIPTGLITIFILEVLLLTAIYFFRFKKPLPHLTESENLLILYSLPGALNLIRSTASVQKLFKIPQGFCKGFDKFYNIMENIDRKAYFYASANFGIYSYTIYKLESIDENDIIRRISHDLKNSLLDLKLTTDIVFAGRGKNKGDKKNSNDHNTIVSLITEISSASVKLSRFISLLGTMKKDTDLAEVITKIYLSFIHHSDFEYIKLDQSFNKKIGILVDGRVVAEIIRNLLENAMENRKNDSRNISSNQKIINIKFISGKKDNSKGLEISNYSPGKISDCNYLLGCGFSSQKDRTGTGLTIARNLAETINADFDVSMENGVFISRILF